MRKANKQIKQESKMSMMKTMPFWFRTVLFFVGAQIVLYMSRGFVGGALGWYLIPLEQLPEAVSGFTSLQNGFELILRMDAMGNAIIISLTYLQIAVFLLVNALMLLLLAPAKLSAIDCCWRAFRGETTGDSAPLAWYRKPRRMFKAMGFSLLLEGGCQVLGVLLMLPGMALSFYLAMGEWMQVGAVIPLEIKLLSILSLVLLLVGLALAFSLHSLLYPVIYCLAAQPDYSVSKIWKRGLSSIKGTRCAFIGFRLSFLPWYILSSFTMGMMDLYLLPYLSFANFHFLQETAQEKMQTSLGEA